MFGFKRRKTPMDEAQKFLESVQNEPEAPDPCESADEELLRLADKNAEAHYDIMNLIVLAVIMVFFGTVLLTLTNKQDFSNDNTLTKESFFSGNYLARIEQDFTESIPLQDLLHNAKVFIQSCFGIGNEKDYIDLNADADKDDPYSVDTSNEYTPITDSQSGDDDEYNDDDDAVVTEADTSSEDDGKNKVLSTITLRQTQTATSNSSSETETSTTTNNRSPGATTTTTVPPETTTRVTTTEPPEETTTTTSETTTVSSEEQTSTSPDPEPAETQEQQVAE